MILSSLSMALCLFVCFACVLCATAASTPDLSQFQFKVLKGQFSDDSKAYMIFTETKMTMELFLGSEMRRKANSPGVMSFSGDLTVSGSYMVVDSSVFYNATGDDNIQVQFKKTELSPIRFSVDGDTLKTSLAIQKHAASVDYFFIDVEWKVAPSTRGAVQMGKQTENANKPYGYYECHKATYLKPTPFSPFFYYDTIVVNDQGYFITDAGVRGTNATIAPNFDSLLSVTGELEVIYHADDDVYQLHVSPIVELTGSTSRGFSKDLVVMDRYAQFSEEDNKMLIFVLHEGERVAEAVFYRQK